MGSNKQKAIKLVQDAARINMRMLRDNPGSKTRGQMTSRANNNFGQGMKELQTAAKPPLGWIWGDFYTPWQRKFPSDPYFNKDAHLRREYPPMSLIELQRLIDLGWIDTTKLIDLTVLCNTQLYKCDPSLRQCGVWLTDEGCDEFKAKVNIEVQWTSELAVAAVERNGGRLTSAFYDMRSLRCVVNPKAHFEAGLPIPRRLPPPNDVIEYYTDAANRGYLANDEDIRLQRFELAQKYGYEFKDIDPALTERKLATQCFVGLQAGWVVNLPDAVVLRPCDAQLKEYYAQEL